MSLREEHPNSLILRERRKIRPRSVLLVGDQPRGGLVIQVGVQRGDPNAWDGGWEWNFIRIPARDVRRLVAFATKPTPPKPKPRRAKR